MEKLHIKRDDTVVVISGDSKGTRGKVIAASPEEGKVIVAGANIVSKHTKARKQGDNSAIIKTEGAIYACKVQLVCPMSEPPGKPYHNVHSKIPGLVRRFLLRRNKSSSKIHRYID